MISQPPHRFVPPRNGTTLSKREPLHQNLHFSELRYRRLFETAQDGILILDAETGKIEDVNPFLKAILHYSHEELVGKELWEIGVFKDIVSSKASFFELQNIGYIRYKDLPLETKDGRSIDVEFVSNVYMVGDQKVIQCNIRDITDRRIAEKAVTARTKELEDLTKSQEETKQAMLNVMEDLEAAKAVIELEKAKDEAMLASIGEGLIAMDSNKRILIINKAAEKMLGWKAVDVMGKVLLGLPLENEKGEIIPNSKRPINMAMKTGKSYTANDYFFVRPDKIRFPIAINVTPIKLGKNIIGVVDIFRDITHEKEIDRAKSEFVSLASHQLRTPLGIMKWYLEAMEHEKYVKEAPATVREYLGEIYKSNERVLNLVRDLLSVSRIEQGRVKNVPKSIDLYFAVKRIVEQMQIMARKKELTLQFMQSKRIIPSINIDILRFHEVIENLIGNAIEYTKPMGVVTISVRMLGKTLVVSVKDTGIGICDADKKKLFTKFFMSEKAIEHNPEGSGLGLYVVKSYVDGWGGKISVKSVVGVGSTFTIRLPIVQRKR